MWEINDLTNKKFGKLKVICENGRSIHRKALWLCHCDCGNTVTVVGNNLSSGTTTSCGCVHKKELSDKHKEVEFEKKRIDNLKKAIVTHGMSRTYFYRLWKGILERCYDAKHKGFNNYGGRGITVCEEWKNFDNFKNDMYVSYLKHVEQYGRKQTSIDRINVNGNYESVNCRWATWKEQANNTRRKLNEQNV